MSEKIKIATDPTENAQTVTEEQLRQATLMHISDVKHGLDYVARLIREASLHHDYTKTEFMKEFYKDFSEFKKTGEWPRGPQSWFQKYHLVERHHLDNKIPEDVNLIDVIEMIVDCVMAAMARKGSYEARPINPDLLTKAYNNTVQMILNTVEVKKTEQPQATDEASAESEGSVAAEGYTFRL